MTKLTTLKHLGVFLMHRSYDELSEFYFLEGGTEFATFTRKDSTTNDVV